MYDKNTKLVQDLEKMNIGNTQRTLIENLVLHQMIQQDTEEVLQESIDLDVIAPDKESIFDGNLDGEEIEDTIKSNSEDELERMDISELF